MDRDLDIDSIAGGSLAMSMNGANRKKSLYSECGMDLRCICLKTVLNTDSPTLEPASVESVSRDSMASLEERIKTGAATLSPVQVRLSKPLPRKLYKNKVDRFWHKRYNYVLPEDQQFDLQPYDEIQLRDEEIALEYFYGDTIPYWLLDNSKDAQDSRARILHRYNKEKRQAEEAITTATPAVIHTRVESIISVNRTRAADTAAVFGPSAVERGKTTPVVSFMEKLCRIKTRERERQLHPISAKSKWHFLRHPSTLALILTIVEAERRIRAGQKFRRTIKVVRAVVRFIRVISIMSRDARHVLTEIHYFQENQRLQTQMKISKKEETVVASRDVFDPTKYRFSSRFKISNDVRMILTKPWNHRSDEEVNKVVERLQELRCFVEYPVSFQIKLARLAWLIEVAADLAIIREGHIAADFYFMLAGKAKMITLHGSPCLTERGAFHTLRTLRNGDAFGDESMSHPDSERTYSVITTEKSTLLSLSSVDYVSMLLKTRDDEQAPEHIIFLSTLSFLQDFPKHKLIEEGDEYIRNYYLRAGNVISESLSESEYIYVVKYGSCRVLVEIPPLNAPPKAKRHAAEITEQKRGTVCPSTEKLFMDKMKSGKYRTDRASSVMEFLHNHRDDIAQSHHARKALRNMKDVSNDKEFQITKAESDLMMKKSKRMFRSLKPETISNSEETVLYCQNRWASNVSAKGFDETSNIFETGSVQSKLSSITDNSEVFSQHSSGRSSRVSIDNKRSSRSNLEKHLSFVVGNQGSSRTSSGSKHAVGTNIDIGFDLERTSPSQTSQIREAPHAKERATRKKASSEARPEGKLKLPEINPKKEITRVSSSVLLKHSRWKLIRTMVKGDYIGHEWVDLNRGPYDPPEEEMSLVSDGCEVIMMNRAFLIKYLRKEL